MKALYIHTSFAGQHHHIIRYLASQPENKVICLKHKQASASLGNSGSVIPNVRITEFTPEAIKVANPANLTTKYEMDIANGKGVFFACLALKGEGFIPDIIVCHSSNGLGLFVKDVFPETPLLFYGENYVNIPQIPAENPVYQPHIFKSRTFNAALLSSLVSCDAAITPLEYQKNTFPHEFHSKFSVIFDGIDTETVKPRIITNLQLAPNLILTENKEIVTYNARGFEKTRGFDTFIQAAGIILKERPHCHIIVVGGTGECYAGGSFNREQLIAQHIPDASRLHFVGELPYEHYLAILQRSNVHIYLTHPFVLSWSFMESLAAGCVVVASNTLPVTEIIQQDYNGKLAPITSPSDIAIEVMYLLNSPEERKRLSTNARQTIIDHYSVKAVLPQHLRLLEKLTGKVLVTTNAEAAS